jgi:hypothetical protein
MLEQVAGAVADLAHSARAAQVRARQGRHEWVWVQHLLLPAQVCIQYRQLDTSIRQSLHPSCML